MARGATKSAASGEAEVARFLHAAVLKLAQSEGGPLKLQSKKGEDDGLFPAGSAGPVKEAKARATAEGAALLRVAGKQGKDDLYELTAAGLAAVGPAVESVTQTMPATEAVRLAERVLEKRPEAVAELEPLIAKLAERQRADAEREAKQRQADAERRERVLEAMRRYQAGVEQRKQARIAELQQELAELGGSATATPAVTAARPTPTPAPKDAKEFVRQEARRLVSAWADAVRLGKSEAQLALEVVLGNLSAVEQIGEEGEDTSFNPIHHECDSAAASGAGVTVLRPGWRLVEEGGAEYVVAKAKVKPR